MYESSERLQFRLQFCQLELNGLVFDEGLPVDLPGAAKLAGAPDEAVQGSDGAHNNCQPLCLELEGIGIVSKDDTNRSDKNMTQSEHLIRFIINLNLVFLVFKKITFADSYIGT